MSSSPTTSPAPTTAPSAPRPRVPSPTQPGASSSGATGAVAAFAVLVAATAADRAFSFGAARDVGGGVTADAVTDLWWPLHLAGAVGAAVGMTAFAVLTWSLCRHRGTVLATVGGTLLVVGGAFFAVGLGVLGAVHAYAADPGIVPAQQVQPVLDLLTDHPARYLGPILTGALLATVAQVLLAVALWRSRAVPRWLAVLFGVGAAVGILVPLTVVGHVVATVVGTLPILLIGWLAVRAARGRS